MSKNDFYNMLKEKRTEHLYQKEYEEELARILAEKRAGKFEKNKFDPETMKEIPPYERPKPYSVENDDQYNTLLWNSMLRDSAFYFDNPNPAQKLKIKNRLQFRYALILNFYSILQNCKIIHHFDI